MPKQDLPVDGSNHSLGAIADLSLPLDRPFEIDFQVLLDRLADVPDEANGLLKLLDGRRTLREALAAAQDGAQAAAAARELSALRIIRPISDVPSPLGGGAPGADVGGAVGSLVVASECAEGAAAGAAAGEAAPLAERAIAPAAPPAAPRIVRFPARRKRLPPPPGRLGGDTPGDLAVAGSMRAAHRGRAGGAGWDGDADMARQREAGDGEGVAAGSRRRRWAAALVIAGALAAAAMVSALVFLRRSSPDAATPEERPAAAAEASDAAARAPAPP